MQLNRVRAGFRRLILAACVLPLAGCYAFSVMQHPSNNARAFTAVPGVPFYVMRSACRHETVYQEDLARVRLIVELVTFGDDGRITSRDTTFDRDKQVDQDPANRARLQMLRDQVRMHVVDPTAAVAAFDALKEYDPSADWSASGATAMVTDQSASVPFVDYSSTYYMNSLRPIVGSTNNTYKLNPNGTLSEGSAAIEDKTLETVGGIVPFKDLLTGAAGGATVTSQAAGVPNPRNARPVRLPEYRYTLAIESAPILHTLSRTRRQDGQTCPAGFPIALSDTARYEYSRKPASAASTQAPAVPKGSNITISGQLTLPPKEQ